jgi:hypothetical protein
MIDVKTPPSSASRPQRAAMAAAAADKRAAAEAAERLAAQVIDISDDDDDFQKPPAPKKERVSSGSEDEAAAATALPEAAATALPKAGALWADLKGDIVVVRTAAGQWRSNLEQNSDGACHSFTAKPKSSSKRALATMGAAAATRVAVLLMSVQDPQVLLALGGDGAALASLDSGKQWRALPRGRWVGQGGPLPPSMQAEGWKDRGKGVGAVGVREFSGALTLCVVTATVAADAEQDLPALWRIEHQDRDEEDLEQHELDETLAALRTWEPRRAPSLSPALRKLELDGDGHDDDDDDDDDDDNDDNDNNDDDDDDDNNSVDDEDDNDDNSGGSSSGGKQQ